MKSDLLKIKESLFLTTLAIKRLKHSNKLTENNIADLFLVHELLTQVLREKGVTGIRNGYYKLGEDSSDNWRNT